MAFHTRSNSFPSRPHLIAQEVDELLCRLRSSEATSTSSSSISRKLHGLQDLQDCVDRLLQLPLTQQALAQEQNEKWTNELLDGSITLFDACATAKDVVLQTKECIMDLQSIRGESGALTSEANKSLSSRKIVKKAIQKALKNLKGIENRSTYSALSKDQEAIVIVSKLRDVEAVTVMVLESVLSFISGPKSKPSSWSLVSKMMHSKKVASDEETEINEFAEADAAFKTRKSNPQNQLDNLESCIQDHEERLESLYRLLIKTKVSFLNVLNY